MPLLHEEIALNIGPARIQIAFARLGEKANPPVFLIMGGGAQFVSWPDFFLQALLEEQLQLILFDNRDSGRSAHFEDTPTPDFNAAMAGDCSTATYSLSDMAADTAGLIEALGFSRVHLIGASMGGMIAQTVAIEHPEKVKSLVSMMSSTGDRSVGQTDFSMFSAIGAPPQDDRDAFIEWQVRALRMLGTDRYPVNESAARERAGLSWDRDHDPNGLLRQSMAVLKSGDRTPSLKKLRLPTLVIHGNADRMIHCSGGKATAAAIPGAELLLIEGMGHGFPDAIADMLAKRIAHFIYQVESAVS